MKRAILDWEDFGNGQHEASLRFGENYYSAHVKRRGGELGLYVWDVGRWIGESMDLLNAGDSVTVEGAQLAAEVAMYTSVLLPLLKQKVIREELILDCVQGDDHPELESP